jgi:hypothetical protein
VIAVLVTTTVALIEIRPLASLVQVEGFPIVGWISVALVALATTIWAEPLKSSTSISAPPAGPRTSYRATSG